MMHLTCYEINFGILWVFLGFLHAMALFDSFFGFYLQLLHICFKYFVKLHSNLQTQLNFSLLEEALALFSQWKKNKKEYQPNGAGGTRSPPAMPHRLQ